MAKFWTNLGNFLVIFRASFHCFIWPNLKKYSSHLVTLYTSFIIFCPFIHSFTLAESSSSSSSLLSIFLLENVCLEKFFVSKLVLQKSFWRARPIHPFRSRRHSETPQTEMFFKKGPTPASFSFIFGLFQTNNTISTQDGWKFATIAN